MPGKKRARKRAPDPTQASFDEMFRAAARRVLERHGVPASRIESEIERLRKVEPVFSGPSLDEVMAERLTSGDER